MIRVEPIHLNTDGRGSMWDVFVVTAKGAQLRAYYGVSGVTLGRVVEAVGHCNKLKDRKARQALLNKELPEIP